MELGRLYPPFQVSSSNLLVGVVGQEDEPTEAR